MYEQVEKPKENKNRATANSVTQKKSNLKQGFGFVDNRPEAVTQRKLQEMVNNSSQTKQSTAIQMVHYKVTHPRDHEKLERDGYSNLTSPEGPMTESESTHLKTKDNTDQIVHYKVIRACDHEKLERDGCSNLTSPEGPMTESESTHLKTKDNTDQMFHYKVNRARDHEKLERDGYSNLTSPEGPMTESESTYLKTKDNTDQMFHYKVTHPRDHEKLERDGYSNLTSPEGPMTESESTHLKTKDNTDQIVHYKVIRACDHEKLERDGCSNLTSPEGPMTESESTHLKTKDNTDQMFHYKVTHPRDHEKLERDGYSNLTSPEGPMTESESTHLKTKDNTDLGQDLKRIQGDVEGYDFDPKSDHYNAPRRYLGNKLSGAVNYVIKHPLKTAAKALPLASVVMNAMGAARSHVKSKEARTEENNTDTSEAQKLMWKANKESQLNNRNRKAVSAAIGAATTGIGGLVDFGAGDAAGDIVGQVFGETGNAIADGALNEATEIAGQFVDPTDASDVASGLGMATSESVSEDAGGAFVEDTEEAVQDVRRNRNQPITEQKPLIRKARLARRELNRDGGDSSLAHRSLLAKDLNYGKAVRKTVRGTLDTTLPERAAPDFDSSAMTESESTHLKTKDNTDQMVHYKVIRARDHEKLERDGYSNLTSPEGPMTSPSNTVQQIETAQDQFDLAKRNKSHMLAHLKESVQPQDTSNRIKDGVQTLKPSQFGEQQRNTKEASMHRLRKDLGYAKNGFLMNKELAEKEDDKLDNFNKKKWFES